MVRKFLTQKILEMSVSSEPVFNEDPPPPYSTSDQVLQTLTTMEEDTNAPDQSPDSQNNLERLNDEQENVLHQIKDNQNVFITGHAGTGKSFLIKYICEEFDQNKRNYCLLAPTGVAAINIGGQTIHRYLGLLPQVKTLNDYIVRCSKRSRIHWNVVKVFIIDEVSMIHPKLFVLFDQIARFHTKKNIPFGGIQVILLGDFFQLCPIRQKGESASDEEYIFETDLWKELNIKVHHLKTVMRQKEDSFISALSDLRTGLFSENVAEMIAKCSNNKRVKGKHYVRLFSMNYQKNMANELALSKLKTESKIFHSADTGDEKYLQGCRAEKNILLKIGCPVMLLWNLPEFNLCNGSIGIVKSFNGDNLPVVTFDTGVTIVVNKQKWSISEKNKYGTHALASRVQIPLAVSYALSSHKVQGISLDFVEADCHGIFTTGQLYVMLSRAKSSTGLIIKNFSQEGIMTDSKVTDFYNGLLCGGNEL